MPDRFSDLVRSTQRDGDHLQLTTVKGMASEREAFELANLRHLDTNRVALFAKSDFEYALRQMRPEKFDSFAERLDRRLNGQTAFDDLEKRHVDPLAIIKKIDLVTTVGMKRLAKLATGKTTTSFTHGACGTGVGGEGLGDDQLGAEVRRVAVFDRWDAGTSMKWMVAFDSTTASGTYTEFGIFDGPTAGPSNSNMFSRSVFNPGGIVQVQNDTAFVFTEVVAQSSS